MCQYQKNVTNKLWGKMLNSDAHADYQEREYQARIAASDALEAKYRKRIDAERADLAELRDELKECGLRNWAQWCQNAHDALDGFE